MIRINLGDPTVAKRHAELVATDDGRFYLTDCATETGTWRRETDDSGGESWYRLRQGFVAPEEPLRFGEHRATILGLVGKPAQAVATGGAGAGRGHWDSVPERGRERPRGRVERDPVTGEIVPKRL